MAALTYRDVKEWDAEPLRTAAEDVKKDADALEEIRDEIEWGTRTSSWRGGASVRAANRRYQLVERMTTHLEGKRKVRKALGDAANQVAKIERLVEEVEAQAWSHDFWISDHGLVYDKRTGGLLLDTPEDDGYKEAQAISAKIRTIVSLAAAADATITNSIPAGHVPYLDKHGTPSPGVAKFWAERTDDERQAIIEQLIEERAKENGVDPGTIDLDRDVWDDPYVLGDVAYEVRHARQREAARDADAWWIWPMEDPFDKHEEDGITPEQAEQWGEDFEDDNRGADREKRPSEVDAREAGRKYVEDELTPDELNRLLEAATGSAPG